MTIRFDCACGQVLQASEEHAGRQTRCPTCGKTLMIPTADQPSPAVASAPTPEPPRRPRRQDEDAAPAGTSGKAVTALILGLGSFCTWFLTGIPALILGILSVRDISRSGGRLTGKGMAIAGMVVGALNTFLLCPGIFGGGYLVYQRGIAPAQQRAESSSNLRGLALAMHNYHNAHGTLPPAALGPAGRPNLSWRVALLPYLNDLEAQRLYQEFRMDEPWDGPNNKRLLERIPKVYRTPGRPGSEKGMTYYEVITTAPGVPYDPSRSALFGGSTGRRFAEIADGMVNTILIVEAADPVPWTKPDDVIYDPKGPLPRFGDPAKDTFLVVTVDGSVRSISRKVSEKTLRSAITPAGGEVLGPDW